VARALARETQARRTESGLQARPQNFFEPADALEFASANC